MRPHDIRWDHQVGPKETKSHKHNLRGRPSRRTAAAWLRTSWRTKQWRGCPWSRAEWKISRSTSGSRSLIGRLSWVRRGEELIGEMVKWFGSADQCMVWRSSKASVRKARVGLWDALKRYGSCHLFPWRTKQGCSPAVSHPARLLRTMPVPYKPVVKSRKDLQTFARSHSMARFLSKRTSGILVLIRSP